MENDMYDYFDGGMPFENYLIDEGYPLVFT